MSRSNKANYTTPATLAWMRRVGAVQISLKKFAVGEGGYKGYVARAVITDDREFSFSGDAAYAPTEEEKAAIEAEVAEAIEAGKFPRSITASKAEAKNQVDVIIRESKCECDCILFLDPSGKEVLFVEQRTYDEKTGKKSVKPWSFWNDGEWRMMEPDGPLPLFGQERVKDAYRVFLHEGAKAARDVQALVDARSVSHPWAEDLRGAAHLGWPGGTSRAGDVDWETIKNPLRDKRVILVCDNDQDGIDAATTISEILQMALEVVLFDGRFRVGFDLADEWPKGEEFWKGEKYVGPSFDDCLFPATWATKIGTPSGKGRPPILMRKEFAREWFWVTDPTVFAHGRHTDRLLAEAAFNRSVRPFSHAEDTAGC